MRRYCQQREYDVRVCRTHDRPSHKKPERKQDQRIDDGFKDDHRTPAAADHRKWPRARDKECDYTLLTQIVDTREHPFDPHGPEISIGGRVPSIDASDSRPVSRENLQVSFAVFRVGRFKPVLDTQLRAQPSGDVSDTLVQAMDRVANRVSHELRKK